MIDDWYVNSRRKRYGGDLSDKVAHVNAILHLPVSTEGPHDGVHQVAWHILLQLIKLQTQRRERDMVRQQVEALT